MARFGRPVYNRAFGITISDTDNIVSSGLTDAVFVGGAGVMVAVFEDDSTVSFTCVAGALLPLKIKRVNETDTTASLMLALYQT